MADLVLLPGMDGTGALSGDFVSAMRLTAKPTIVSYPDEPSNYAELTEYVRSQLPTDRPYVLIAESFSGPIAIALAAESPPGLEALVLVCTSVRCPIRIPRRIARLCMYAPVGPLSRAIAARFVLGRFSTMETQTKIRDAVSNLSAVVWRSRMRSVIDVNFRDKLKQVKVPVLSMLARRDRVIPRASSVEISKLCPGGHTAEIDGPHFLLLCKPVACAEAVRAFADKLTISL